jgi:hypothetical protein
MRIHVIFLAGLELTAKSLRRGLSFAAADRRRAVVVGLRRCSVLPSSFHLPTGRHCLPIAFPRAGMECRHRYEEVFPKCEEGSPRRPFVTAPAAVHCVRWVLVKCLRCGLR